MQDNNSEWFIYQNKRHFGPVEKRDLARLILKKQITADAYITKKNQKSWVPVTSIAAFKRFFDRQKTDSYQQTDLSAAELLTMDSALNSEDTIPPYEPFPEKIETESVSVDQAVDEARPIPLRVASDIDRLMPPAKQALETQEIPDIDEESRPFFGRNSASVFGQALVTTKNKQTKKPQKVPVAAPPPLVKKYDKPDRLMKSDDQNKFPELDAAREAFNAITEPTKRTETPLITEPEVPIGAPKVDISIDDENETVPTLSRKPDRRSVKSPFSRNRIFASFVLPVFLPILYPVYWVVSVCDELHYLDSERSGSNYPVVQAIAMFLPGIHLIAAFMMVRRLARAQKSAGLKPLNAFIATLMWIVPIFPFFFIYIVQGELNRFDEIVD